MQKMKVIVVGEPTFRQDVALAMDMSAEAVRWFPAVADMRDSEADIIALSPSVDDDDAIRLAETTRRTSPRSSVILVRESSQNGMLPTFMRAGLADVVDLSQGDDELKEALHRAMEWSRSLKVAETDTDVESTLQGKVITFFSSKGGTGKSFLASNVAAALADMTGRDTALIDLDLDMGDVFSYFGTEPGRPIQDLATMEELDEETIRVSATDLGDNLYGFGAPLDPGGDTVAAEAMQRLLRGMKKYFDFIVLDSAADYSDLVISALDLSDTICLVSGLDVVGIKHLVKSRETLLRIGIPLDRVRVVLNRADSKVSLGPLDVEKVIGLHIDSMIPSSRLVPNSLNLGVLTYTKEPDSDVSQAVRRHAEKLAASFGVSVRRSEQHKKRHRFLRKG